MTDDSQAQKTSRFRRPSKLMGRTSRSNSVAPTPAAPKPAVLAAEREIDERPASKGESAEQPTQLQLDLKNLRTRPEDVLSTSAIHSRGASPVTPGGAYPSFSNGPFDRVAQLEKALADAQAENKRVADELSGLRMKDRMLQGAIDEYREQMVHAQAQQQAIETLRAEIDQEIGHRKSFSRQQDEYEKQINRLKDVLTEQDTLMTEWNNERTRRTRERDSLMDQLHMAQKQARDRGEQVLELKQSISTLTRMESQVTDIELSEEMDQLYHKARDWTVSNFRKDHLGFSHLPATTTALLDSVAPDYRSLDASSRLALYQGLAMKVMMDIFDEELLYGLPERGPLGHLRSACAHFQEQPSATFNNWRATTILLLHDDPTYMRDIESNMDRLIDGLISRAESAIGSLVGRDWTSECRASYRAILRHAVTIAHKLRAQRASFVVQLPDSSDSTSFVFDPSLMDDLTGDEDIDDDAIVQCSVFPALCKIGDEEGADMSLFNVVTKAKVLVDSG